MIEQLDLFGRGRFLAARMEMEGGRRRWKRTKRPHRTERGYHEDSLAAYGEREEELRGRKAAVWEWLREHGPATDREVRDGVTGEGADMNTVRPRITDLIREGRAIECGETQDAVTGLTVRMVAAVEGRA